MFAPDYREVAKYGGSVGLLVDRCVRREHPFGTVWMVSEDRAVTCAHLLVLFQDFLPGLKVHFPATGQDFEIVETLFHPKFDQKVAMEMAQRSLSAPVPAMALQDNNLVVLKLSRYVSEIGTEQVTTFNKRVALAPLPRLKGLAGHVDELGLALVIQTVANSRKDGVLFISDERNRPIARLFCREGKIVYARFDKLQNELAVYQMFAQDITGQFNFRTQTKPDWRVGEPMNRSVDALLLEAHRRIDEKARFLEQLGGNDSVYTQATDSLDLDIIPEAMRANVSRIWPHLDGGVSIDQLWEVVNLDDFSVLSALAELKNSRQIVQLPPGEELMPAQALEMAPHLLLTPWDSVVSLTVHPSSGRPQLRRGSLVGLLRPNEPYHLLHTLNLSYRSAGSPIFKEGKVIGMHCGMLPLDPQLHALPEHLHQLLWVESITQTLAIKPARKSQGMRRSGFNIDGAGAGSAVAGGSSRKICPKCSAAMVNQAKFCGTCGQKLG